MSTPRLFYDRRRRPFLEDASGVCWRLTVENGSLEFISEAGEHRRVVLLDAWEDLSAEELEVHRRSAEAVDPGEHTSR